MKTNINHESENAKHNGYRNESLSVKDALVWFAITVAALFVAGTSQAQKEIGTKDTATASPVNTSH